MAPIAISSLAFVLMLLGIAAGGWVQGRLPEGHLSPDSKEVIKLSMGVMGTLAALVLGLLVANTQNSYSARESEIKQLTAHVILLDTLLNQYGNEAQNARALLRNAVSPVADRIWREGQSAELQSAPFKAASQSEAFFHEIQDLQPSSDNQREIKQRLVQITTDAAQARYLLFSHLGSSIPIPFLAVLLFWLVVLFAGFAVLARPNATTLGALIICALSVSGAMFLMLELDQPFSGTMAIHSESFRNALPPLRP